MSGAGSDRWAQARGALLALVLLVVAGTVIGVLGGVVGGRLVGSVEVTEPPPPPAHAAASKPPASSAPGTGTPAASPGASGSPSPSSESGLRAQADVSTAAPGQRITITGSYPDAPAGTGLQVQRRVGGSDWRDFPVTTHTSPDGTFSLWIRTSVRGPQELRLLDPLAEVASDPIQVTVG